MHLPIIKGIQPMTSADSFAGCMTATAMTCPSHKGSDILGEIVLSVGFLFR